MCLFNGGRQSQPSLPPLPPVVQPSPPPIIQPATPQPVAPPTKPVAAQPDKLTKTEDLQQNKEGVKVKPKSSKREEKGITNQGTSQLRIPLNTGTSQTNGGVNV